MSFEVCAGEVGSVCDDWVTWEAGGLHWSRKLEPEGQILIIAKIIMAKNALIIKAKNAFINFFGNFLPCIFLFPLFVSVRMKT